MEDKERNTSEIDEELGSQAKEYTDIGQFKSNWKKSYRLHVAKYVNHHTQK